MSEPNLHERVRDAILTLQLVPGERLSERGLEPLFRASRTPIRAALMRLESEGLVRRDDRGWTVSPIDIDELRALYEFREVLESSGVRLAIERASRADLEALAEIARAIDVQETPEHILDAGTSFHQELARLSGNPVLGSAMEGVMTRLYRTRWLEAQSQDARERIHREHSAIADALLAGDAAAAELAAIEHLRGTGSRLIASLENSRTSLRARGISMGGGSATPRR